MNADTVRWSRRYQKALLKHLQPGSGSSLLTAEQLGRQAAALGMETLDVARFHERAMTAVASPAGSSLARRKLVERATSFFAETIVPIEKTHRAALNADVRVNQLTQTLRRRTAESSASTRHLEHGIAQRKAAEAALAKIKRDRIRLLQESNSLQSRLRSQTHMILSAQEKERQNNSSRLHDEIAQALLAINIRLLTLKTSAKVSTGNLAKAIAETQEIVRESAKTISGLAHEFSLHHEA